MFGSSVHHICPILIIRTSYYIIIMSIALSRRVHAIVVCNAPNIEVTREGIFHTSA